MQGSAHGPRGQRSFGPHAGRTAPAARDGEAWLRRTWHGVLVEKHSECPAALRNESVWGSVF